MAELGGDSRFEVTGHGRSELPQSEKVAELYAVSVCELSSAHMRLEKSVEPDEKWKEVSPYAGDIAKR